MNDIETLQKLLILKTATDIFNKLSDKSEIEAIRSIIDHQMMMLKGLAVCSSQYIFHVRRNKWIDVYISEDGTCYVRLMKKTRRWRAYCIKQQEVDSLGKQI